MISLVTRRRQITGKRMAMKLENGRELHSFRFKDEDESQEVRAVDRRVLLETLDISYRQMLFLIPQSWQTLKEMKMVKPCWNLKMVFRYLKSSVKNARLLFEQKVSSFCTIFHGFSTLSL